MAEQNGTGHAKIVIDGQHVGDVFTIEGLAEHDRELIERCARVAEELLPRTPPDQAHGYTTFSYAGATVAAAIRALSADAGSGSQGGRDVA